MAEKVSTQDALKKLEAQLECSLCLDKFRDPKLLPCFHVFCKSPCLEKLVSKDGHSLTCPTCRHVVQLSEKGVAGLQSDFHIEHLFEIKEAFDKAKDSTETQCGNCGEGKATGYCQDCGEYICNDCQAAHKKMKPLKDHKVMTLDEMRSQAAQLKPQKKSVPNCSKHSDKPLRIYCETCKKLICSDCTIRQHREHDYDLMSDVYQKHKQELVTSLKPVKEKLELVEKALKDFDLRGKQIHEQRATLEADIHKEIDQLHRLLDQRRAVLLGELDELTQQKVKELAAQRDQVEMTQAQLSSCLEYTEGALETGTEGEVLAMKAPVMDRIQQISAEFNPDSLKPETEADIEITREGKQELEKAMGEVLQLEESKSFSVENSKLDLDGLKDARIGQQKTALFAAKNKKNSPFKHNLKIKAEISDKTNEKKRECQVAVQQAGQYKVSYTPVRRGDKLHITVNGKPIPGSPFRIAVQVTAECFQQPTRVIRGLTKPRQVAVNSKGHMVVNDSGGSSISILTPDGEKICSFGSQGSGDAQLSDAYGVTVDKDDNIYVSDSGNYCIQKFSAEGNFVNKVGMYGNGELQFYYSVGITYNHNDNLLYVADNHNHRIQVITTDLTFVRAIGKQGTGNGEFTRPLAIAFDSASNLYVADCSNNRVQVLTTTGQFLRCFSQKANGVLSNPWTIAIDSSDTLYVSETGSSCMSVFSSQGDFITSFQAGTTCYGLTVDKNDTLIVSDVNNGCLYVYSI